MTSAGPTIFVAHSSVDIDAARHLRNTLEELNHDVLLLKLSQNMTEKFLENLLRKEIQARDWLVVIRSENSQQSKWVEFEERFARERGKPVFSIDLDRCRSLSAEEAAKFLRKEASKISRRIRVFLSYSRNEQPLAQRLARDLRLQGFEVWLDLEQLKAGEVWATQIQEAIDRTLQRGALVFLLSEQSARSEYAMSEVKYALGRKGHVIPCLLGPSSAEMPDWLRRAACADFSRNYEQGFRELLESLHATP